VVIVTAGWGVLGHLAAGLMERQERLKRTIGVLGPELQRQDEEQRRLVIAAAREAALGAFASQGPRLARVMEAIGLAAPPDVVVSALHVEPGVACWRVVVEGQAEGADAGAAHTTFNQFLKALEASPLLGRRSAPPSIRARTSDPADVVDRLPVGIQPEEAVRPAQPVSTPRPAASGPSYIEVARDGRLYRIPLRRSTGDLEASRRMEESRRLQEEALARQAATTPSAPPDVAALAAPGRFPASVVEFTLRYEVAK
jgi:hypothetical protein